MKKSLFDIENYIGVGVGAQYSIEEAEKLPLYIVTKYDISLLKMKYPKKLPKL